MIASIPAPRIHQLEGLALECRRHDRLLFTKLDFCIGNGQVLQVEGANGSGKTSLLRLLCGLSIPTAGAVHWCGENIQDTRDEYFSNLVYVGHRHGVKDDLTAPENLRSTAAQGPPRSALSIDTILDRVGLRAHRSALVRTFSAGQRQRLALARLLLFTAPLWILDEPFTALDQSGRTLVEALLAEHSAAGGITVVSTHQLLTLDRAHLVRLHLQVC